MQSKLALDRQPHLSALAPFHLVRFGQDNLPSEVRRCHQVLEIQIALREAVANIHQTHDTGESRLGRQVSSQLPPPLLAQLATDLRVPVAGKIDQKKGVVDQEEVQGPGFSRRLGDAGEGLSKKPVQEA